MDDRSSRTWRAIVDPELVPLLDSTDSLTLRIKQDVADLVERLPGYLTPAQALVHVRVGAALSAAGADTAAEVASISRESDEREEALEESLIRPEDAQASRTGGDHRDRFVVESLGLAIGWVVAVVTLVLTARIAIDGISGGGEPALAGAAALLAALSCTLLETRRANSLVSSVRTGASALYGVLALCWIVGLVATAVRVLAHDQPLTGLGTAGVGLWFVALVLMTVLVVRSVRTDQRDGLWRPPADPDRDRWANGLRTIQDRTREREHRVYAALSREEREAVSAGELEGIRLLLLTDDELRRDVAEAAVLAVRDRRRSVR